MKFVLYPIDLRSDQSLFRFLFDAQMAIILVGPEKKKFVVHQALLCDKSKYFAKALTGSFEESKTGTVQLEDVSPILFKILVNWLYHSKVAYTISDDGSNIDQDFAGFQHAEKQNELNADDASTWPKHVLVELYVLADRFDTKELRRNTIDALLTAIKQSKTSLERESYMFIGSNTTAESPLWKLAMDRLAYYMRHNIADQEFWFDLPHDMAITALLLSSQRVPRTLCNSCYQKGLSTNGIKLATDHPCKLKDKKPLMMDMCVYHEHADDEEKKACQASRDKIAEK